LNRTGCSRPRLPAIILVAGAVLALFAVAPARAETSATVADSTFKPQGSFYVEILGSAFLYSFNYDYRFSRHAAVRAGFEAWGSSGSVVLGFPVTASALIGGRGKGFFEIGGGPVFVAGSDNLEDFEGEVLFSTFVAFRLQPPEGGFFMRAGIGPIFGGGDWIIWPALSFGYSF
jgi:hypothetical protein